MIGILRKQFFFVKMADTKQFDIQEFGASSDSELAERKGFTCILL